MIVCSNDVFQERLFDVGLSLLIHYCDAVVRDELHLDIPRVKFISDNHVYMVAPDRRLRLGNEKIEISLQFKRHEESKRYPPKSLNDQNK